MVRASRDGDQFHYLWAARRCLRLLSPSSGLAAITIEGASPTEFPIGGAVETGEEVIDVGEYYGSQNIAQATLVRYIQLKHSTLQANVPWAPSGLEATLAKFALRYVEMRKRLGSESIAGKLEFQFVSNRPISDDLLQAIEDAAREAPPRSPSELKKLEEFTNLQGADLAAFCKLLRMDGGQAGYWAQRNLLFQDVRGYLPEADIDGPLQLKELVTQKALSQNLADPSITQKDVLRALRVDEADLFPARCLIEPATGAVSREQEGDLIAAIVNARARPVLIHAAGGVGKTVFATRIQTGLPPGSVCILYDCFGNGEYRNPSRYRHRHKTGLVQIANELAAEGFCHPLIPASTADASAYLSAFLHRLNQVVESIRAANPDALVCLAVDAADNAQIAADEIDEPRSFPRDLLRVQIPDGVRLVVLCRTERRARLDPPPNTLQQELRPFSRNETAAHLRHYFPDATERDIDEFHWLSSHNPRVQAMALSRDALLSDILRRLGPNPSTVETAIEGLLEDSITKLRDLAPAAERGQIDRICTGLALLRPFVPISVLASISGVDEAAIKSFAIDLGRPLHLAGETIQFFDEPAETWFQQRFKAKPSDLTAFLQVMKPLAPSSAYVASALPSLMLEAGQYPELVEMALSSKALPTTSRIERRNIELHRLQFALKASLHIGRNADAAKLALKAGGESAGHGRESALLQSNTDLAAALLDTERIEEIGSRGVFGAAWFGSRNAYEAGLMAGKPELIGEARSRLRVAEEWLWNWSRLPDEQRQKEQITDADIAELALAHFQVHGASACAKSLHAWTPPAISFRAGRIVARRLVDHGRYQDVTELARAAGDNLWLVLAATLELRAVHRNPPIEVVERAVRLLLGSGVKLDDSRRFPPDEAPLAGITAIVAAAAKLSVSGYDELAQILTRYLPDSPPLGLSSEFSDIRFTLLRAYTLRAALRSETVMLEDLAHPELRQKMERNPRSHSQEEHEFQEKVGALLPWHRLWVDVLLGRTAPDAVPAAIASAQSESAKMRSTGYRQDWHVLNEVARIWIEVLVETGAADGSLEELNRWIDSLERPLFTPTLTYFARMAAGTESFKHYAPQYANRAFQLTSDEREDAEMKAEVYVDLARAMLAANPAEARAYFDEAVEVAGKIGDENLSRWAAILDLAGRAADSGLPAPEIAYKLARCAELTHQYVVRDKHFDWGGTVRAIAGLCPSSSLAILSRWRDRRFGWPEEILPVAVRFLLERGDLDGRTALALIGFRAQWKPVELIASALAACATQTEKQSAASFVSRYMVLHGHGRSTWRALKDVLASRGLAVPDLDDRISFGERADGPAHAETEAPPSPHSRQRDWGPVFGDADLTSANGLSLAYSRFRVGRAPLYSEEFFAEACRRVPAGREAKFVRALPHVKGITLYDLRHLLEQLPGEWRDQLSLKHALVDTLKAFCRAFCFEITAGGYYEVFPFELASELCGFTRIDAAGHVLSALAEGTEPLGAKRLFTLIGLLVLTLAKQQALEALSFGLHLFDDILEPDDGDGLWSPRLVPPPDIEAAVAGYVWRGLAAPEAGVRWEAAHVVRGLCTLGRGNALSHLIALAKMSAGGPFADAGLHFYDMHARQWLMIALARVAQDYPRMLAPHADFLIDVALNGAPHVLIRGFAAKGALELLKSGAVKRDPGLEQRLEIVNRSPFPVVTSKNYDRIRRTKTEDDEDDREDTLYFDIDAGTYWFAPLGECFALSEKQVEHAVRQVIRVDWQYAGKNRWDEDQRHTRKIFNDRETWDSRSDPRTHDLQFYLTYHAVMIVAGKLLSRQPAHHDPEYPRHDFDRWLDDHGLSRPDGRWLADRRDPAPLERPEWKGQRTDVDWRWSIRRGDFDRLLVSPDQHVNVWGDWTVVSESREESISARSALVSPGRSEALLRALQSSVPFSPGLPTAGDDDTEIAEGEFQLKGWVAGWNSTSGLDERDPWAGEIGYPPHVPAPFIVELMGLGSDPEGREWILSRDLGSAIALRSQVWGEYREREDQDGSENGRRLQASSAFIAELLRKTRLDLIVKVQIQRWKRRTHYNEDYESRYSQPSARFFLFKSDGDLFTI